MIIIHFVNHTDCFVRNHIELDHKNLKYASCEGNSVLDQDQSEYDCQEQCRKCKDCRFFAYFTESISSPLKQCYTYETDKEELRGKKLKLGSNSGKYSVPMSDGGDGNEYDFLTYGPPVCGKSS